MEITSYSSFGVELNIPAELLIEANLELGTEMSVFIADGMLLIAATDAEFSLTGELGCFMDELGYDPELIFTVTDEPQWPWSGKSGDDDE